jgi:hypothetical protein
VSDRDGPAVHVGPRQIGAGVMSPGGDNCGGFTFSSSCRASSWG